MKTLPLIFLGVLVVLAVVYIFSSNARTRAVFERFCPKIEPPPKEDQKLADVPVSSYQLANITLNQKIPQLIYQTNERELVPVGMAEAMSTVATGNLDEYSCSDYDYE